MSYPKVKYLVAVKSSFSENVLNVNVARLDNEKTKRLLGEFAANVANFFERMSDNVNVYGNYELNLTVSKCYDIDEVMVYLNDLSKEDINKLKPDEDIKGEEKKSESSITICRKNIKDQLQISLIGDIDVCKLKSHFMIFAMNSDEFLMDNLLITATPCMLILNPKNNGAMQHVMARYNNASKFFKENLRISPS